VNGIIEFVELPDLAIQRLRPHRHAGSLRLTAFVSRQRSDDT